MNFEDIAPQSDQALVHIEALLALPSIERSSRLKSSPSTAISQFSATPMSGKIVSLCIFRKYVYKYENRIIKHITCFVGINKVNSEIILDDIDSFINIKEEPAHDKPKCSTAAPAPKATHGSSSRKRKIPESSPFEGLNPDEIPGNMLSLVGLVRILPRIFQCMQLYFE